VKLYQWLSGDVNAKEGPEAELISEKNSPDMTFSLMAGALKQYVVSSTSKEHEVYSFRSQL
jgi:hypothetical protein